MDVAQIMPTRKYFQLITFKFIINFNEINTLLFLQIKY